MKQFGTPLREPLLSTNPLFLSNFFITPLFVQISKTRSPLILVGRGNYDWWDWLTSSTLSLNLNLCNWIFAVAQNNLFMVIMKKITSMSFSVHLLSWLKGLILHDREKNYTCLDWCLTLREHTEFWNC